MLLRNLSIARVSPSLFTMPPIDEENEHLLEDFKIIVEYEMTREEFERALFGDASEKLKRMNLRNLLLTAKQNLE